MRLFVLPHQYLEGLHSFFGATASETAEELWPVAASWCENEAMMPETCMVEPDTWVDKTGRVAVATAGAARQKSLPVAGL